MVYRFCKLYPTMHIARMFKTIHNCSLVVKRSSGLSLEKTKFFRGEISCNYCSIATSNNKITTSKDPGRTSVEDVFSVGALVDVIKSNIRLKYGQRYDNCFRDANRVVEYLLKYEDVKPAMVERLFTKQPSLCQYYSRNWENTLVVLHGNGLQGLEILNVLEIVPQILKSDPVKVDDVFICLRQHQFYGKGLFKLVSQVPELLVADASFISKQIKHLMTLFTQKDIQKLAINSPQVLLHNFEDTEEKVRYIVYEVGVEQTHIVSNSALSHSLHHIQLRHQVMLRTGIYRKPHPKKNIENPRLSDMLNTSTKKFAEDICHISLEEYKVFERMLELENAKKKEIEGVTDSESDSEIEDEK